jgi:hypothetical protein
MAIGTSITPRGYDIDETGKAYTLDPKPLLDAQSRTFQLQRESMNTVYETGRKGVAFAEYLGARQQLGRMKAELSDLDPEDPLFYRKYSEIIGNNPLAFTHEKTAPIAKMALAPIATEATRVRAHQDEMEKVRAQAINRAAEIGLRYQNQGNLQNDRQSFQQEQQGRQFEHQVDQQGRRIDAQGNRLESEQQFRERMQREKLQGGGGSNALNFLFGRDLTDTPQAETTVPPGTTSPDAGNYPTKAAPSTGSGSTLLPQTEEIPFAEDGLIGGQGDVIEDPGPFVGPPRPAPRPDATDVTESPAPAPAAPAPAAPAAAPVPPEVAAAAVKAEPVKDQVPAPKAYKVGSQHPEFGWMATNAGWMRITKVGNDVQFEPVVRSEKPDVPEGYLAVPDVFNEDKTVAKWKAEKEVERSAAQIKKLDDNIQTRLAADPEIGKFSAQVIGRKAELASLKTQLSFYEKQQDEDKVKKTAEDIEVLERELEIADLSGKRLTEQKKDQILNVLDPEYAAQTKALRAAAEADAAAEKGARELVDTSSRLLGARPELGYMEPEKQDITATPEAPRIIPASEQLAELAPATAPDRLMAKKWTAEKSYALDQARKLSASLNITEDALLNAVKSNDTKSLKAILQAAQRKGIENPLLLLAGKDEAGKVEGGASWAPSGVGRNYLNVLKAAANDESLVAPQAGGKGKTSTGKAWSVPSVRKIEAAPKTP